MLHPSARGFDSLVAAHAAEQQLVRPQQRRGGRRGRGEVGVGEVKVGGVGHAGGGPGECAGHLVGDERRAAKWACPLVVVHPPVEAAAVEDVAAVGEAAHLVAAADAAEAHRAVAVVDGGADAGAASSPPASRGGGGGLAAEAPGGWGSYLRSSRSPRPTAWNAQNRKRELHGGEGERTEERMTCHLTGGPHMPCQSKPPSFSSRGYFARF